MQVRAATGNRQFGGTATPGQHHAHKEGHSMDTKVLSPRSMTVVMIVICILSAVPASPARSQVTSVYHEAPMLAELVKAGKLPPVDQRLPQNPMLIQPEKRIGVYGGV
jgi:hypothetical protein